MGSRSAVAVLLVVLCVLPAIATARHLHITPHPLLVQGRVYCDTCRAGFETSATRYIAGARVKIECKDRQSSELKFSVEGVTDSTGTYNIAVADDHQDDLCDAMLVSSPESLCSTPDNGRDRARVILTRSNGIVSDTRFANNMGFLQDEPMSGCTQLLQSYLENDQD